MKQESNYPSAEHHLFFLEEKNFDNFVADIAYTQPEQLNVRPVFKNKLRIVGSMGHRIYCGNEFSFRDNNGNT